MQIILFTRIKF